MKRKLILIALLVSGLAFTSSCKLFSDEGVDNDARNMAIIGMVLPQTTCFNCHSESSELGLKILSAKTQWEHSTHANGTLAPIFTGLYTNTNGTVVNAYTTGAYMQKAVGYEFHGSNSFYANAGGCQVCHTHEGFVKKVSGSYADSTAESADYITNPSPIGCFTCHEPHTKGSFGLRVADGTAVTTDSGASYAKASGNICASCHKARFEGTTTTGLASVLYTANSANNTGTAASTRLGPHHSPTTDMLLGKGGAETSGQTYGVHTHGSGAATCTGCHMTMPAARASFSPGVGGHSFKAGGDVHGTETINLNGCKDTACHGTSGLSVSVAEKTSGTSTTKMKAGGHIWFGDATPFKAGVAVTAQNAYYISELLKQLADPANGCAGLLSSVSTANTFSLAWETDALGVTNGRCVVASSSTYKITPYANPAESDMKIKFLKAIWNYRFITEDKSFGVHNPTYVRQLLFDDITNLGGAPAVARP